jgi:hypothetical protein
LGKPALQDVFGVPPRVKDHSYVDRGGLDERLRYDTSVDRIVIIHGDSKQGKTWLRQNVLPVDECVSVQCQLGATPASLLTQALGLLGVNAELRQVSKYELSGSMDLASSGELGVRLLAKLKLHTKLRGGAGRATQRETAPVGRTPADLAWVARVLTEAGKRLVIEDFHYLDEDTRKQFAFLLKALSDYGVHPVIIGVWSQDHLLTYYNGDLAQRLADIHIVWTAEELEQVLVRGGEALNVTLSPSLRQELIRDAYGNIGTLQALAEALCLQSGVREHQDEPRYLGPGPALTRGRQEIARGMQPRFQQFAEAYVAGLRALSEAERGVLCAAIELICERPDDELLTGVSLDQLADARADAGLSHGDLVATLRGVERFQSELEISPLLMTFNRHAQKLCVIDRRFLFYRRYGTPRWPWDEPDFSA